MTDFTKGGEGGSTTQEAIEIFDSLEPVEIEFMIGSWQGEGYPTNHPLDRLLEAYHWHGKRVESAEEVFPLVFSRPDGGVVTIDPKFFRVPLRAIDRLPLPKSAIAVRLFQLLMPLLTTRRSQARLRMTRYRGRLSATMIYDDLPISDVFRKIDDDTVMGLMDLKGMKRPFFFILGRERETA